MAKRVRHPHLVFRLSCWMLGLIAFAQLLVAGVAVAVRVERAQVVRVEEKVVTRIVTVAATPPKPAQQVVAVAPASPPPALPPPEPTPLPPARPLAAPPIADPVVERLVQEARKARLADDMASALNKLEEAQRLAPGEPSVLYETGMVYETMAAFDTRLADQASDAYLQVMALGTTGAGALYPLAAAKIRDGISMPADLRGELALGRPRIFPDDNLDDGERVIVTVPVQAAPGTEIAADDLEVRVNFFDSTMREGRKQIQPAAEGLCETLYEWVSGEFDFVGGEELLRVTYILPPQELQQDHLFGKRRYYGQTVEVYYKGEVIDSFAWPRHLSSRPATQGRPGDDMPQFLTEDMIEIDPYNPLLPTREGDIIPEMPDLINPDGSFPPLPEN
jgi:hypothetical protein